MVLDNIDTQTIVYASGEFNLSENELKSNKKLRLEGFISTTNRDENNDIVTEQGQVSLFNQIKERIDSGKHVTMDLDHESFRQSNGEMVDGILNKIPVAMIDDVELVEEEGVTKTKVQTTINTDHPLFDSISNSIKNKFLHSFSIAYKVTDGFITAIDGVKTRIINDVILRNVGITGVPVNEDAGFEVSLKSYLKKMEQEKQIESLTESMTELKSQVEAKDTVIAELKSQIETANAAVEEKIETMNVNELKSKLTEVTESLSVVTELKSKFEASEAKVEELSTTLNELKSKAIHKAPAVASETKTEDVNVFTLM